MVFKFIQLHYVGWNNSSHPSWIQYFACKRKGDRQTDAILKPSSEAQNSFWIKSRTEEDMGQFSASLINKAVQSFTNSFTSVH